MARPARYDITAYRGDGYDLNVILTDSTGAFLNTTTTAYFAQWRAGLDDPDPAFEDFTVTVLSPGTLRLSLTAIQTTRMNETGYWDLEQRAPLTDPRTLLAGSFTTAKDVTHHA